MTTARRFSIGLLLLSLALAPLPALAQEGFSSTGGTQVSVEGSLVTITVSIDLALGGVGETTVPEGAQATADGLAQEIADYWNQGFERLSSVCVQFKLVVKINVVPQADAHLLILGENRTTWITTPGRHVVFWGEDNFGNAAPPETYDEYDEDGIAPPGEDYGAPLEHELWSIWSPHLENARDFAHELGHLMGFGDDYANGEPLPGREGTLMDSGDLIDQNLVNRLADIVRNSGKRLPECWEGEWAKGSGFTYSDSFCPQFVPIRGTIRFTVADDDSVSGHYEWANDPYTCGGPAPSVPSEGEVTGERTADGFRFDIFGAGYPLRLTRQGNEASGKVQAGGNTTHALTVRCVSCG